MAVRQVGSLSLNGIEFQVTASPGFQAGSYVVRRPDGSLNTIDPETVNEDLLAIVEDRLRFAEDRALVSELRSKLIECVWVERPVDAVAPASKAEFDALNELKAERENLSARLYHLERTNRIQKTEIDRLTAELDRLKSELESQ